MAELLIRRLLHDRAEELDFATLAKGPTWTCPAGAWSTSSSRSRTCGRSSAARGMHEVVEVFQRGMDEIRDEWRAVGRDEGRAVGRRTLLRRMAARRFGAEAAREFGDPLDGVDDPERLDEAGDAVIDCAGAEELLRRARSLAAR